MACFLHYYLVGPMATGTLVHPWTANARKNCMNRLDVGVQSLTQRLMRIVQTSGH